MSEDDEINFYPPVAGGSVMKGVNENCIIDEKFFGVPNNGSEFECVLM